MARRQDRIVVKLSHSCSPDPAKVDRGLELWAAYLAENVRTDSRLRRQDTPSAGDS